MALPSAGIVIRIASNPDALERVKGSVRLTRWLHARGYPCVEPALLVPFKAAGLIVSVWRLLDTVADRPGSASDLATLLRDLHQQPDPPVTLTTLDDPLASVSAAVQNQGRSLDGQARAWLLSRIGELRDAWSELGTDLPPGLIHGDAHSNNLIRTVDGRVLLGDWDHAAHGPREWDLIQPFYMARRFSRHSAKDLDDFAHRYGYDVRQSRSFETLIQIREISGLSAYIRKADDDPWSRDEVAGRVRSLRRGDTSTSWHPPSAR
nr:aminoglycoside phosphotransferase family protein [Actinomadura harenae]